MEKFETDEVLLAVMSTPLDSSNMKLLFKTEPVNFAELFSVTATEETHESKELLSTNRSSEELLESEAFCVMYTASV